MGESERVASPPATPCKSQGCSTTRCCALVRRATRGDGFSAREALSAFCEASWHPVYAHIRACGYSTADAEDLTQGYFTRFLEKDYVGDARSWQGCFRPFLRVSVRHFLSNERDRERAAKRGGGRAPLSLDAAGEQGRSLPEPADPLTPEVLLERQRAEEVLAHAVAALRAEFEATGRMERFERLETRLVGEHTQTSFGTIAAEWGVGESAVRATLLRLRRRLAAIVRAVRSTPPRAKWPHVPASTGPSRI
jgi:DNA-directed RNA polymerase specialized sigma24 family protein